MHPDLRSEAVGDGETEEHQDKEDAGEDDPERDLRPEDSGEHRRETERVEPQEVGPEAGHPAQGEDQDEHHGDRNDDSEATPR